MICHTTCTTDSYTALGDTVQGVRGGVRAVMMLWCSLARGTAASRLLFGVSRCHKPGM